MSLPCRSARRRDPWPIRQLQRHRRRDRRPRPVAIPPEHAHGGAHGGYQPAPLPGRSTDYGRRLRHPHGRTPPRRRGNAAIAADVTAPDADPSRSDRRRPTAGSSSQTARPGTIVSSSARLESARLGEPSGRVIPARLPRDLAHSGRCDARRRRRCASLTLARATGRSHRERGPGRP